MTDSLVPASVFNEKYADDFNIFMQLGLKPTRAGWKPADINALEEKDQSEAFERQDIVDDLKQNGLTIPQNVIIIGTVNMDDTTNTFSRKVIDRAMTIEMNGGNLSAMFGGSKNLEYLEDEAEQQKWQKAFAQRYVSADEVLEAHPQEAEHIMNELPDRLNKINNALKFCHDFSLSQLYITEYCTFVIILITSLSVIIIPHYRKIHNRQNAQNPCTKFG